MGEFGDKFRKAREQKELSLDDVSNVTKINSRMLRAIEEEHFDRLPGGVFNKGFIRAYAKHLGLNSDEAVTDYLATLRQAQIETLARLDADYRNFQNAAGPQTTTAATPPKTATKAQEPAEVEELPNLQLPRAEHIRPAKKQYIGKPSSGTPWIPIALAALLVVAGIVFWIRQSRNAQGAAAKSSAPTIIVTPAQPPAPAPNPVAPPVQPQPTTSSSPTATASPTSSAPIGPAQQLSYSEDLPVAHPSRPAPTDLPASDLTGVDSTGVKVERKGDVTIRSFGTSPSKLAENPAATLTLVVRASENSWISVTSDGQLLTKETLIAPAATSFHASHELIVRVGNAAGISFLWNGDELPPQGAENEAKTFVFDSQGMRASAPPPPSTQN